MVNFHTRKNVKKYLIPILGLFLVGMLFTGTLHSESPERERDTGTEVLYYDKSSEVKIVNKNGFLLKIEKNDQGLKEVSELGPYPDAYPDDLPEPKEHVEQMEQGPN